MPLLYFSLACRLFIVCCCHAVLLQPLRRSVDDTSPPMLPTLMPCRHAYAAMPRHDHMHDTLVAAYAYFIFKARLRATLMLTLPRR